MVIIKKLKHNAFERVDIPAPRDLFQKVGQRVPDESKYSGDENISQARSKVELAKEVAAEVAALPEDV